MKWGQQFAAEALLGHGADKTVTGQHGRTPLHCAVVNRWAGIAEKLLFNADRTNINAQDDFQKTPLCRAVSMFKSSPDPQTIVMVQTLLQNGADQTIPDESEYTPLQIAALCHMVEMVTLLVKFANPNIINAKNPKEQTALHLVFEMCKPFHDPKIVKIVEILVENGADPTIPDRYLNTALHYAAQCSFAENAKILLDWAKLSGKRIINAPNWQGKTALHLAIHSTGDLGDELRIEMIIVLLEFGANPWIGDDLGKTPVHYAAQISSIGITKLLLQDTDLSYINLQDLDLQTPLHLAVNDMFNDAKIGQMFDYLRSKGADPGLRDRNGHSPSDLFKRLRKNSRVYAFRRAMCSFGNRLVSQFRKFP
uniref:Uncharacterized protein n=3 Tax=Spongospora subterranea TaxID=70186 RepID=A0A0H5RBT8_9EUKA|eukprot:CRZ05922.1 hypothetical protein [Spongospora subterranea]